MGQPDHFLRPPEKADLPYEEIASQDLWDYHDAGAGRPWPLRYCTDAECARLSGVPERSLLTLQTAEIINATKAPIGSGSYRRVWHLPEAAAATVFECLKRSTNIDYRTIAKIVYHSSVITKMVFFNYVKLSDLQALDKFEADLILSNNSNLYLRLSKFLRAADPHLSDLAVDGIIPIAGIEKGEDKRVPMPDELPKLEAESPGYKGIRQRYRDAFDRARFYNTVNLKNVFQRFEREAREIRTASTEVSR